MTREIAYLVVVIHDLCLHQMGGYSSATRRIQTAANKSPQLETQRQKQKSYNIHCETGDS